MSILQEFKEFAVKGNVIDMAVGIIIGAAFTAIVKSLVGDMVMPPVGMILGGKDFSDLVIVLQQASDGHAAVTLGYGKFIQTVLNFIIMAVAVFAVVKGINSLKRKKQEEEVVAPEPAAASEDIVLLTEIRDLLKQK